MLNNQLKINRLKSQIKEFISNLENSNPALKSRLKESIEARERAIEFLEESRKDISFKDLEKKFGIKILWR